MDGWINGIPFRPASDPQKDRRVGFFVMSVVSWLVIHTKTKVSRHLISIHPSKTELNLLTLNRATPY
jgi:hypothetical protein